ncbi:MAG: NAD(P)-dependent oxidoreductase [Verrucomicrobiota bacterium]
MRERILITGGSGCIGQATVRWLRGAGHEDLGGMTRSGEVEGMEGVKGDVSDRGEVEGVLKRVKPGRVIHLAGWQTPDCEAEPFGGMAVNLGGTDKLVRAMAGLGGGLERFVFASSAAVYGRRDQYAGATVHEGDLYGPPNLYGYWKVAGEGMARAFERETGVATVSLRLATTYGPGRDRGLTAAPTEALKAAARGESYAMPYDGREHYHFVDDVGAAFGMSAVEAYSGYGVFNLRGVTMAVREFLDVVMAEARGMGREVALEVAEGADVFPFVCDLDDEAIVEAFPGMPLTEVAEGVRKSLGVFGALSD